jgi:signal transduction histidine kinase
LKHFYSFLLFTLTIVLWPAYDKLFCQTLAIKDSLGKALENARDPKIRVDILNDLSYEYYDFEDSIAINYATKAFAEANRINYAGGKKRAHSLLAIGHLSFGDYEQALREFKRSLAIRVPGQEASELYALTKTGNAFMDMGHYDSAEWYLQRALALQQGASQKVQSVSVYKELAMLRLRQWRNEEAKQFLEKALESLQQSNVYLKLDTYFIYASYGLSVQDYATAEKYTQLVCSLAENIDDNYHKATCRLLQADRALIKGELTKALLLCFEAMELSKIYTYQIHRAQIYIKIAEIYNALSEFDLASEYLFKSLAITEKSGLRPTTAQAYVELAWVFKDRQNFKVALQFADNAQRLYEEIGDQKGVASCHNVRGLIYLLQKRYEASIQEHERALTMRRSLNALSSISASLFNLALTYEELGQLKQAKDLYLQGLAIDENSPDLIGLATTLNGLVSVCMKMGDLREAENYLDKAYTLALQTTSLALRRDCYTNYVSLFEKKGDTKKALVYQKRYQSLSDSIYSENNGRKLAELNALYQVERKQKEIEILNNNKVAQEDKIRLQQLQLENQQWIIISIAGLLLLTTVSGVYILTINRKLSTARKKLSEANRLLSEKSVELQDANESLIDLNEQLIEEHEEIQAQAEELTEANHALARLNEDIQERKEEIEAQSEELREANEMIVSINQTLERKVDERTQELRQAYFELDTFFYRSSHDFRRPITTFMGLAEVASITLKDPKALELFDKVYETARSLDKMIRKLHSISDVGAQELVFKEVLLKEIIGNILRGLGEEIDKRHIRVEEDVVLKRSFESYSSLVHVVLENVIENAIHFSTPIDPYIKISARDDQEKVTITIEDNGQGIAEEYKHKVFDMYYRGNITSKGNGLGLYIAKKAVARLHGSIRFTSALNNGSVFIIEFPLK